MKNYNKTDYAANVTNENAIVYRFADGTIKHITADDFGGDVEAFRKWKEISDKDYYAEDRRASNISKKEVPLSVAGDLEKHGTPSVEDDYITSIDNVALFGELNAFVSLLTEAQKRRLYLLAVRKMRVVEIAKREDVDERAIRYTFTKIRNMLKKYAKTISENGEKKTLSERINFYERLIKKQTENE